MKNLLLCLLIVVVATPLVAQVRDTSFESRISDVGFSVWNNGVLGPTPTAPPRSSFTYPRDSNLPYIFGSGLWFGARKRHGDSLAPLVFIGYNPRSGGSWATPGEGTPGSAGDTQPMSWSSRVNTATGAALAPGDPSWPLWWNGTDPVSMIKPGIYVRNPVDRHSGSYVAPAFVPNVGEQVVNRFHDTDLDNYELPGDSARAVGFPLGLQVQQNIYAWKGGSFGPSVIVQYEIIHIGTDTLYDCYIGQLIDPDIGDASNDHASRLGVDTTLRGAAAWTAYSRGDVGKKYGFIVFSVVEGPVVRPDGTVSNAERHIPARQLPLTAFRVFTLASTPRNRLDMYGALSTPRLNEGAASNEFHALLSCGPFMLRPGDSVHFAIAFSIFEGKIGDVNLPRIPSTLHALHDSYYGITTEVAAEHPTHGSTTIAALPNPANSSATISGSFPGAASVEISAFDALGRMVLPARRIVVFDGRYAERIDLSDLPAGLYIVRMSDGETVQSVRILKEPSE